MAKFLINLSQQMFQAVEAGRDGRPRGPWIEQQLAKVATIKKAAKAVGVELPERPADSRGGDRRPTRGKR